ncbi:MAG: PAS-domain containing protein, partial [Gemmatimonadetes bacterium]|nr:PAS-domain containing protein [Gemmatimonadota bacterium]
MIWESNTLMTIIDVVIVGAVGYALWVFFRQRRKFVGSATFLVIVAAGLFTASTHAAERVVLQLRWDHQFQFAGYYAALWRGYYDDAGLEVEIRSAFEPDGRFHSVTQEIAERRADFGIAASDILIARHEGNPLVILASIFQQSPVAFYATAETGLQSPVDLTRLRVATLGRSGYAHVELLAMLRAENIDPSLVSQQHIQSKLGIYDLAKGVADVATGFTISADWLAAELGLRLTKLRPATYGVDFYGDTLFTHRRLVKDNPRLVQKFITASLKGWEYALAHSGEIADRISREFTRTVPITDFSGFNRFQIEPVKALVRHPLVEVGHINPRRWQRMHEVLKDARLVKGRFDPDDLIFNPERMERQRRERIIKIALLVLGVGFLAGVTGWAWTLRKSLAERTHAEAALRESEARFRAVVDNSPTKIHIKDAEGRYVLVNPEAEKLFGFTDEEIRGKTTYDVFPKDVADAFTAHDRAVMESGETVEEEEKFTREDGEHTYLTVKFPIADGRGGISGVAAIGTDITERNRAEREIVRQSALLEKTFQSMSQGISVYDADLKLVAFNQQYIDLTDFPPGFLRLGMPYEEIARFKAERGDYGPGDVDEHVRKRVLARRARKPNRKVRTLPNGRVSLYRRDVLPDGGYVATYTDITERKQAEEEIAEKSALLEATFESISHGFAVYGADLRLAAFNQHFVEMMDYPPGLIEVGRAVEDILRFKAERGDYGPCDVAAKVEARVQAIRRGEGHQRELTLPNGRVIALRRDPMPDGRSVTSYTDITQLRMAEQEIAEKSALLETTFESMSQGIRVFDADLRLVAFNQKFIELWDYPPGFIRLGMPFEEISRCNAERGVHGTIDVEAHVRKRVQEKRRGKMARRETKLPSGLIVVANHEPMPDGGTATTYTDITEEKRAAAALRESEGLLRTVLDNLPVGVSLKDREGRYELINKQFETWYGFTNDEARGRAPDELMDETPQTRAARDRQEREIVESGKVVTREDEKRRADGTSHSVMIQKFPVVDSHGKITSFGTVSVDITERKRAEEEIAEKSSLLEATFQNMSQGISVFDADLKLVAFNERYVNMWRYPEGFIRLGMPFEEIARFKAERGHYGSGDVEELIKRPIEAMRQGKHWREKCGAPSGTVFESHRDPMPGGGVIDTFTDITERERAEAEIAEKSVLLETTFESMSRGITIYDADHRLIAFNRRFVELFDFPPGFIRAGRTYEDVGRFLAERGDYGPGDVEELLRKRVEARDRADINPRERTRPDGTVISARRDPMPGGGYVTTYTDITERKRVEAELIQSAKLATLGEIAAGMVHELSQPLNIIRF